MYINHCIVSLSLNTFLTGHVFDWLGLSVSSMYSTLAFPGVEEFKMEDKIFTNINFSSTLVIVPKEQSRAD